MNTTYKILFISIGVVTEMSASENIGKEKPKSSAWLDRGVVVLITDNQKHYQLDHEGKKLMLLIATH